VFVRLTISLTVLGLLAACAPPAQAILVEEAWARPAEAGTNSAVYFRLHNGSRADELIGVESGVAQAMIHLTILEADGIVRMEHQMQVSLAPGEMVVFEPGGLHVMLMDLAADLQVGSTVDLLLMFRQGGAHAVEAIVRQP
jgi:hypothetical protein